MINFKNKSNALDTYGFTDVIEAEPVTGTAFDNAREKIKSSAFKELFEDGRQLTIDDEEAKLFNGFRINAIDRSVVLLPKTDKLTEKYGKTTPTEGKIYARTPLCIDVLNGLKNQVIVPALSMS